MTALCSSLGQNTRPRILVSDDHLIFAETLSTYLSKTFTVIGVVTDGQAMLQQAIELKPDVVVADISMPLLNGLDTARTIRERTPRVALVFLTMLDDANLAAAALELGHVAFVLKRCGGREVLKAIEETLHGRSYLTPSLRVEDCVEAKARVRQFGTELTERQSEFIRLFAEGHTFKEIATVLNVSEKTVEFHKRHIMGAFNLKSNADLVLFALKRGLISVRSESYSLA